MKYVALLAAVCALTACRTTANRFDLFAPDRASGPYTERLHGMTLAGRFDHSSHTYTVTQTAVAQPPAAAGTEGEENEVPPPAVPEATMPGPAPGAGPAAQEVPPGALPGAAPGLIPGINAPAPSTLPPSSAPVPGAPPPGATPPDGGGNLIPGLSQ